MSSTTVFKRLFEIQILHDYFLTTEDGTSFFHRNKAEKENLISKKIVQEAYDVRDLFEIEVSEPTKQLLSNYKMLISKTSLGFLIGVEVDVISRSGEVLYKPRFDIDTDINLTFLLKPKVSFFKSITNISLRPPMPFRYYVTNKDKEELDEDVSPAYTSLPITNKVSAFQKDRGYEMGALAKIGTKIKEALKFTTVKNFRHWNEIEDKRFVNDADHVLLPHKFTYRLADPQNSTTIHFTLEDENGDDIKTIEKTGEEIILNIPIDLTRVDENDEESAIIPTGFYMLKIKVDDKEEVKYPIYLNEELYDRNYFATIDIRFDEENSAYSLLDTEGFLKTRIDATDKKVIHPIFEIRFRNRKTYWRYQREGDFSASEIADTSSFLQLQSEKLISKDPKALTAALVPFQNGSSLMLPHPRMPSIKVEKDRIFSEIYISQSNRLLKN